MHEICVKFCVKTLSLAHRAEVKGRKWEPIALRGTTAFVHEHSPLSNCDWSPFKDLHMQTDKRRTGPSELQVQLVCVTICSMTYSRPWNIWAHLVDSKGYLQFTFKCKLSCNKYEKCRGLGLSSQVYLLCLITSTQYSLLRSYSTIHIPSATWFTAKLCGKKRLGIIWCSKTRLFCFSQRYFTWHESIQLNSFGRCWCIQNRQTKILQSCKTHSNFLSFFLLYQYTRVQYLYMSRTLFLDCWVLILSNFF